MIIEALMIYGGFLCMTVLAALVIARIMRVGE